MKATKIMWDVDYAEDLEDLPEEIEIPDYIDENDYEAVDEYLTEQTGVCHKGYVLDQS